jgi:YebC/PmpR family DNA-binding regulatory protein
MSGHSHAKTIKHQKDLTDQKRGRVFSKLAKMIAVAAKEKGGDPNTNYGLKIAMERAKESSMPQDNIEKAIKRGTGELGGEVLEGVVYEAYGPGGIAIIIEGITDNKNRSLNEVKQVLNQYGGKMVGEGAVMWMFERKGTIIIDADSQTISKEDLEIKAIESGAEDIYWEENVLNIYTKTADLEKTKKAIEDLGIKIESARVELVAKESVDVAERETCEKLYDALDENDDVQGIYWNLKY